MTSKPDVEIDLSDVTGSVVAIQFTPINPLLPVTVFTASLVACSEIGKFRLFESFIDFFSDFALLTLFISVIF